MLQCEPHTGTVGSYSPADEDVDGGVNDDDKEDVNDGDKESGNCETEEDDGDKDDSKADGKKKGGKGGCKKTRGVISNVLRGVSKFFG